jgi:two-component system OmpR family response regulator
MGTRREKPIMLARLLLVEDHAVLAEATAEFLRRMGIEVRIARSAAEALKAVEEFGPEIVLCDLGLPDRSGLDVARALRTKADMRRVLFVVHTALADTEIRILERQIDRDLVQLFLSKPITEEKIATLLREFRMIRDKPCILARSPQDRAA